jgi:flavin reductase (DIM6/NTAB) family NADH-FMN oxidoreductase RutF
MTPDETYQLLRTLTSPVVAVTSTRGTKRNGLISDGAIRGSIVPDVPRLGVFIHKFNFTHDMIYDTGAFGLHVLHSGQVDVVKALGFVSGRDQDKLAAIPHSLGTHTGVPLLTDCFGWFECRVCNVMDTGSSTFFFGDAIAAGKGPGQEPLEPHALRANLGEDIMKDYAAKLKHAQDEARAASAGIVSIYRKP